MYHIQDITICQNSSLKENEGTNISDETSSIYNHDVQQDLVAIDFDHDALVKLMQKLNTLVNEKFR